MKNFFLQKSISGVTFLYSNSATHHFQKEFFPGCTPSRSYWFLAFEIFWRRRGAGTNARAFVPKFRVFEILAHTPQIKTKSLISLKLSILLIQSFLHYIYDYLIHILKHQITDIALITYYLLIKNRRIGHMCDII